MCASEGRMSARHVGTMGEDVMNRVTQFVQWAWTRVSIGSYQRRQAALGRQDADAAQRLDQQRNGGRPYGDPGWGHVP